MSKAPTFHPANTTVKQLIEALRPIARVAALWLMLFTASRLLLMLVFAERVAATGGGAFILLQGLRFDLVVMGQLLGPLAILAPWGAGRPGFERFIRICLATETVLVVFVEASTLPFIFEYDARPNILFVEYLAYPREVFTMLLTGHLLELAVIVPAVTAATWVTMRMANPRAPTARLGLPTRVAATMLLSVVVAMMVRSTLDHRPVNPSTVAFSPDSMVNQLALSSPYTLMYAVYEQERDSHNHDLRYGDIDPVDAIDTVLDAARLVDGSYNFGSPTMHMQHAARKPERPYHLVIVMEESLGAEFVGSLGGEDLTPRLDELRDQGIWFDRLYATGTRSVRGIEAVITGFPPTPRRSVVKLGETQRHFFTLASVLRQQGYRSGFVYGGEAHFDNMARFLLDNGFDFVIDEKDYPDPVFMAVWGVSDEDLFARVHREIEAAGDTPLFVLAFSSSNHDPFDIPPGRVQPLTGDEAARRTAVRYADYALGGFFDRARASDYWDHTVFLVVADHNSRTYGDELVPIDRFHIPGVILGGPIEPRRVPGVTSQIDLLPTLLSLLGIDAVHPAIGRDLTQPQWADGAGRAIMQFHDLQAYMEQDSVVVLRPDLDPELFDLSPGGHLLPADRSDSEQVRRALAHAAFGPLAISRQLYFDPADPPPEQQATAHQAARVRSTDARTHVNEFRKESQVQGLLEE